MSEQQLDLPVSEWFEVDVPVRGYGLSLKQIKEAYKELQKLNNEAGERLLGTLVKPADESQEAFVARIDELRGHAFRLTVSIIGGRDNVTKYGENEAIFDSHDLPAPINTVFFTNESAFKRYSGGQPPRNSISIWLQFSKPPLLDPNPLVSSPTPNASLAKIKSTESTYFRAAQSIVEQKLKRSKLWYSPVHGKFAYDVGLWLIAAPYALYTVTYYTDRLLPEKGSSYRPALLIYGILLSLALYRLLTGYLKWAFPVNILLENKDVATSHRVVFGVVVLGLLTNLISHFFGW